MLLKTLAAGFGGAALGATATYGFLMMAAPFMTDVQCYPYELPAGHKSFPVCAGMAADKVTPVVGSGFAIGGVIGAMTAGFAAPRRRDDKSPRP